MKKIRLLLVFALITLLVSSCAVRLVDFTIISSKVHTVYMDKSLGVKTEGKSTGFLGLGANIKDAVDDALANAGKGYDLLIDGVIRKVDYFFVAGFKVEGIAINSVHLRAYLGEEGFNEWLLNNNVYFADTGLDIDKDN